MHSGFANTLLQPLAVCSPIVAPNKMSRLKMDGKSYEDSRRAEEACFERHYLQEHSNRGFPRPKAPLYRP